MRRAQPIPTPLVMDGNQGNLFLAARLARLHFPVNLSFFRFICTFQESYDAFWTGKCFLWII